MKVLFIAGFGPISTEPGDSRRLYQDALSIEFQSDGDYLHTGSLDGARHFAVWSLADAATSCFGNPKWPSELAVPQAWVEFEVEDIEQATSELGARGYELLTSVVTEPWGQRVTRFISPEGLLAAIVHTPWFREQQA